MKARRKPKRAYRSALRERQELQTRELILEAVGAQILASRPGEFSLPEVAARAGVSVRTLYRHFGDREGLLEALHDHAVRRIAPPLPASLDELLELAPALFATFDAHAPWVEAMVRSGPVSALRAARRPARVELFRALTAQVVARLPPGDAAAAQAIFKHLVSAETWLALREAGVDGAAAGRAVALTLRALAARLAGDATVGSAAVDDAGAPGAARARRARRAR